MSPLRRSALAVGLALALAPAALPAQLSRADAGLDPAPAAPAAGSQDMAERAITARLNGGVDENLRAQELRERADQLNYNAAAVEVAEAEQRHDAQVVARDQQVAHDQGTYARQIADWERRVADCKRGVADACAQPEQP